MREKNNGPRFHFIFFSNFHFILIKDKLMIIQIINLNIALNLRKNTNQISVIKS